VRGKWVRARDVAERHVIEDNYAEWETVGPPEVRGIADHAAYFNAWANAQPGKAPVQEPPGNKPPAEKEPPAKEPPIKEPNQIRGYTTRS
jgi:hypothetical protein